MNCPFCDSKTMVMQSIRKNCSSSGGSITRRRKCELGHLSYTEERFVGAPAKVRAKEARTKTVSKSPGSLKVTANSPDWLKRIAERI